MTEAQIRQDIDPACGVNAHSFGGVVRRLCGESHTGFTVGIPSPQTDPPLALGRGCFVIAFDVETGAIIRLSDDTEMFLDEGPGEVSRARLLLPGEVGWTAHGRKLCILGQDGAAGSTEAIR
jgi:hypothetical protein